MGGHRDRLVLVSVVAVVGVPVSLLLFLGSPFGSYPLSGPHHHTLFSHVLPSFHSPPPPPTRPLNGWGCGGVDHAPLVCDIPTARVLSFRNDRAQEHRRGLDAFLGTAIGRGREREGGLTKGSSKTAARINRA